MDIKHLKIEKEEYITVNSEYEDQIDNLSKVNIFIGANNSGKSRFMRSLFFIENNYKLKFIPNDKLFDKFMKQVNEFKNPKVKQKNMFSNKRNSYENIEKSLNEIEYLEESEVPFPNLRKIYLSLQNNYVQYGTIQHHKEFFEEYFNEIPLENELFNYNFYKIYIPSLRGLIPVTPNKYIKEEYLKTDLYAERTKQDYFGDKSKILTDINEFIMDSNQKTNHAIITGMQFYDNVKNYLLGDLEQRKIISDYEEFLSKTFFNDEKVVIIPKIKDDVLTVRIADEEYKIYELGEGIQSIILITLPLFLYLDKVNENTNILVFIEEPEVGLHPRLQRVLIETLLDERFENYQFFFTTHSNHFIDQTLINEDISVYLFDKEINNETQTSTFNIHRIDNEYWNVMENLGAMPSSTLMTNCTILVEGVTDKNHFELYLDLYQKQLKGEPKFEHGIHYSFLIAGGAEYKNTIRSLNELQKEKIFFICDYDNEDEDKKRREFLERHSFNNYHTLSVTEVENLISKDIVLKTLENTYDTEGLEMNKSFTQEDYSKSINFYEFIKEKIFNNNVPNKFANKKGDLKIPLCRNEIKNTGDYNEITQEAKDVAKLIYEFIKQNN